MIASTEQPDTAADRSPWLRRLWFFARVSGVLLAIAAVKVVVHWLHWEVLAPNPLFPALVAFLL
jgi:hypothetical protein